MAAAKGVITKRFATKALAVELRLVIVSPPGSSDFKLLAFRSMLSRAIYRPVRPYARTALNADRSVLFYIIFGIPSCIPVDNLSSGKNGLKSAEFNESGPPRRLCL
jgi:hypothetical protein